MIRNFKISYLDKSDKKCIGNIEICCGLYRITIFNYQNKLAGELSFYYKNNKAELRSIYCMQKYRGKGVGYTLIGIMESMVVKKAEAITGLFVPKNNYFDEQVFGEDPNLRINVAKFYERNGYLLVDSRTNSVIRSSYLDSVDERNVPIFLYKSTKGIEPRFEFMGDILFDKKLYDIKDEYKIKKID